LSYPVLAVKSENLKSQSTQRNAAEFAENAVEAMAFASPEVISATSAAFLCGLCDLRF
jgi:hypothetical protein